jgi:hypothetical protein
MCHDCSYHEIEDGHARAGCWRAPSATWRHTTRTYARRSHPLLPIVTEIYLCHACSCHEILRMETPGQVHQGGDHGEPRPITLAETLNWSVPQSFIGAASVGGLCGRG